MLASYTAIFHNLSKTFILSKNF